MGKEGGWGLHVAPSTVVRNVADLIDSARVENKKLSSGTTGREWYIYHARGVSGHLQQSTYVCQSARGFAPIPCWSCDCALACGIYKLQVHKRKHFIFFTK
jgi:hypothetical protein